MSVRVAILVALLAAALPEQKPPALTVLSAGAVEAAVAALAERYQQQTGGEVRVEFGTAPEIAARLTSGFRPDVIIAPPAVVERAVKAGQAMADTPTPLARVGVGVAVRQGASHPQIATVDQLRASLLAVESVVYNQASTGQYLETLFAELGIAAALRDKTTRYGNAQRVLEHVIAGHGREIGFGPITEIKTYEPKGLVLVGPLPGEVQNYTTYVGVAASVASRDAARALIRFLSSAESRKTFVAVGAQ